MQPQLLRLFLFHSRPEVCAVISDAVPAGFQVEVVGSWGTLLDGLRAFPLAPLVVVEAQPNREIGAALSSELRRVLRACPFAAVLASTRAAQASPWALRLMGQWGVVQVIPDEEIIHVREIKRLLAGSIRYPLQPFLDSTLPCKRYPQARRLLDAASAVAIRGGTSADLAKRLHVSSRTLQRLCANAALPPPRDVMGWIRLLTASHLLDQPGLSTKAIARACGYAAPSGLRRALLDTIGMGFRELRSQGAFSRTVTEFENRLPWLAEEDRVRSAA